MRARVAAEVSAPLLALVQRVWSSYQSTQTFGVQLHVLQARHNCVVPRVLRLCVEYLRAHGMAEVGLFRVPGSHNVLEKVREDVHERRCILRSCAQFADDGGDDSGAL